MPSAPISPCSQLRELRYGFLHKLQNRPAVEMFQYGNVTLIHKKLDSWIDSKPELATAHYSWTEDQKKLTLEHDHLSCRKQRLKWGKLERSWSGNINLIQRDSMIDVVPEGWTEPKKRTKSRRLSGHDHILGKHNVPAKDILLDDDIQTIRKIVLEKKLCQRPLLPYPEDYKEGLFRELKRHQGVLDEPTPCHKKSVTSKPCPPRILYRTHSLDRKAARVFFMPQSA